MLDPDTSDDVPDAEFDDAVDADTELEADDPD